jgi:hypothetical protein
MKFYSILLVIGLLGFSSCGSKEVDVVTEEASLATDEITLTKEQEKILVLKYGSTSISESTIFKIS